MVISDPSPSMDRMTDRTENIIFTDFLGKWQKHLFFGTFCQLVFRLCFIPFIFICLIGVEVKVKLQTPELDEMHHVRNPPDIHHLMQRIKMKIAGSEKQSMGYETMTTVSDLEPEVSFSVYLWVLHKVIE